MIATGRPRRPGFGLTLGARPQVFGVEFVKACVRQSEFTGRRVPGAFIPSMAGDRVTNAESGESFD
jgi:hypothetical protein